jgi:hypothetical protein
MLGKDQIPKFSFPYPSLRLLIDLHFNWIMLISFILKTRRDMKKNRVLPSIITLWLAIISCNLPGGQATQEAVTGLSAEELAGTVTALASAPQTATFTPITPEIGITQTATITPTLCTPIAVSNTNANIRSGPGTVYPTVDAVTAGTSLTITGKNADGTWWYIAYPSAPGGYAWIAGSVVDASCLPASVAVIAAPPTPLPASGTCKDGYVYRLIKPGDKVCVTPASKAQADADNAAADSRKLVTVYGATACKMGYVWREAYSGDTVCVVPATRSQAAADNAAAASRWVAGAYGPHTCIAGFVWREATSGDDVCVTPDNRTLAASDNSAASSRVAGPDDCISGYERRQAFSGDRVCVTPAVKSQVAADNAAAPSHTW